MDTLALPNAHKPMFFLSSGLDLQPRWFKKKNGHLRYENVAVFRSGTFRDSMGYQNTWEDIHMRQMVANFDYLRENKTFDDVPVRDGHPGWIINNTAGTGAVVGWHTALRAEKAVAPHDGQEYTYLFADYDITEPYAIEKIENGTWRNRSSEIGGYATNSESEFWPVYMGFAFVDIPAVEGLKFNHSAGAKCIVMLNGTMLSKETQVTSPTNGLIGGAAAGPGVAPVAPTQPATPVAPAAAPAQQVHAAPVAPAPSYVFTVNGQTTSDFASVQAHILALEGFAKETRDANRRAFVKDLVTAGKIAAPSADDMEAFALTLSDTQYEAWKKPYETAPALPLLAQHGAPSGSGAGSNGSGTGVTPEQAKKDEINVAKEIVAHHKRMGAKPEAIKATPSYKKLIALGVAETEIGV